MWPFKKPAPARYETPIFNLDAVQANCRTLRSLSVEQKEALFALAPAMGQRALWPGIKASIGRPEVDHYIWRDTSQLGR